MSENLYLLSLCLPLGTILLVFGMRYAAAVRQASARLAHDDAYRQLAQTAVAGQTQAAVMLPGIQTALTDVAARLGAIETLLSQVG